MTYCLLYLKKNGWTVSSSPISLEKELTGAQTWTSKPKHAKAFLFFLLTLTK